MHAISPGFSPLLIHANQHHHKCVGNHGTALESSHLMQGPPPCYHPLVSVSLFISISFESSFINVPTESISVPIFPHPFKRKSLCQREKRCFCVLQEEKKGPGGVNLSDVPPTGSTIDIPAEHIHLKFSFSGETGARLHAPKVLENLLTHLVSLSR